MIQPAANYSVFSPIKQREQYSDMDKSEKYPTL